MVKGLFSEADAREIEGAIARVETRSATELVVAVVEKSADYSLFRMLAAVAWTLGAALALFHFTRLGADLCILAQVPIGLAAYALLGVPALHRRLIRPEQADRAVQMRAFALFAERGVHRTRDRTGLLIFISELEHRVIILGDSGLHARVHDTGWAEHVQHVVAAIRRGEPVRGILEVIRDLEPILAEIAPSRTDDSNELPDALLRG